MAIIITGKIGAEQDQCLEMYQEKTEGYSYFLRFLAEHKHITPDGRITTKYVYFSTRLNEQETRYLGAIRFTLDLDREEVHIYRSPF